MASHILFVFTIKEALLLHSIPCSIKGYKWFVIKAFRMTKHKLSNEKSLYFFPPIEATCITTYIDKLYLSFTQIM